MDRIYFDNAATAFPKAPGVGDAMKHYIDHIGCNVKRGVYKSSLSAEETVFETRERLCRLFNFDKAENIVFTLNITYGLNFLLKGILKHGDHCIVSSMEHNAVMRPLSQLKVRDVSFSRVQCDACGRISISELEKEITDNTKAVVMTHASNVCGTVLPLHEVGKLCSERGLFFIIDSAQSAGILNLDFKALHADAIAFTGHKGLLGPQGVGGFLINDRAARVMDPLISGGTGSFSEFEEQPEYMPDKFEAGTANLPGIFGLHAALNYLEQVGIDAIREEEMRLAKAFMEDVSGIPGLEIIGLRGTEGRTAVVSLNFTEKDNAEVAYALDQDYGIMTRCGLHCAPSAHKTLRTFPDGTVRFSFSHFNTLAEIELAVDAIRKIIKNRAV